MSRLSIAVAKGDGIGPEIMNATLRIFEAARVPLDYKFVDMGKHVYLSGYSTGMTPDAQNTVEKLGILFKGPMETPKGGGVKSINVTARKVWNTFANKRVFQSFPGVDSVFAKAGIPIDLTLVRENIEDTYGGIEHMQTHDVAQCRRLITRPGSDQVHRYAFEVAKQKGARRLTCAHKANIMKITDGLFLESFYSIAKEFPDVKADDVIVDDLAMKLAATPQNFDTIVLPNLQGDIISDLCAGLVGGLGMAPSANVGDRISIFEAVHGTAPDIAGKGYANPTALLLSGLIMLRHLHLRDIANGIQDALVAALKNGERTKDLAPPGTVALSTEDFAQAIIRRLPASVTEAKISSTAKLVQHKPPTRPAKHVMHVTPKNTETVPETTVGVDIFVDSSLTPDELGELLSKSVPTGFKLTMLSNRGTQVWPRSSMFTECVNHYRARVEALPELLEKKKLNSTDMLDLAHGISKKVRVCSLEMLLKIGEKNGYTLAQGQ